jgi:hypothetical protein
VTCPDLRIAACFPFTGTKLGRKTRRKIQLCILDEYKKKKMMNGWSQVSGFPNWGL